METLASFIQKTRDDLGMSAKGLAMKSGVDISIIEDVESGKDLFLSVTVRQKLSKALKIEPEQLIRLERGYQDIVVGEDVINSIKQKILQRSKEIYCPKCGALLVTRIAKIYDLEDNLVLRPKAHCSKCVFQLKD
ncbi:hypothetical protein IKJ53_00965 [bacterium]|nr:hypothetical protein [bacterium]